MQTITPTSAVTENAAVIVYGPPACGKTRSAFAIASLFNKTTVVDDWKLGDDLPHDAVCLTNDERLHGLEEFQMPGYPPSAVFEFIDISHTVSRRIPT
ncbi:MAG TPA: hypothetical protein VGE12_00315 [Noviherbaspirillum sp.]